VGKSVYIFYCYARTDEKLRDKLEKHLRPLEQLNHIIGWSDQSILPGATWQEEIEKHLNDANLVLLLISPDFFSSDNCMQEMHKVLQRQKKGDIHVIPIILRHIAWKMTPLAEFQVLPKNGKPITQWSDQDKAFLHVVDGIARILVEEGVLSREKARILEPADQLITPFSWEQLHRCYLEQVRRDTELTTLKGIPTDLISSSVHLAEIYIPPRFYKNRARVDFPVSNQELDGYRESLERGRSAPDLERVVLEAGKSWQRPLEEGCSAGLDVVWEQLKRYHAIVIQGYQGMGKSTLMERLALHMALRGLHQPDSDMPEHEKLMPELIPVLLSLGQYANDAFPRKGTPAGIGADGKSREGQTEVLSLPTYLLRKIADMDLPGLTDFMHQRLLDGACLMLLDGLDEVSDSMQREEIQEEIKRLAKGKYFRCYFIITSRVAGYDQAAFPDYPHFTLAPLGNKEINDFLPRWCRANLNREGAFSVAGASSAQIDKEVEERVQELQATIRGNKGGMRELADNPLLLTLLLVMQQNSIVLPQQRVEFYDTVTRTLLENRQVLKKPEVSEVQAIQLLGPLAVQMQEANSNFLSQSEVEKKLMEVISHAGGAEDEVRAETKQFLWRVRVRGGLFVLRVGDYLGFMHRTFQEYFAARHIINTIKTDQDHRINELVQLARRRDALWREPFLLAVAYLSYHNDEHIASEILRRLVEGVTHALEEQVSAFVLATEAIIEARTLAIRLEVQTKTAEQLLVCYEQAQCTHDFETCERIESAIVNWLLSLPKEAYRPPLLHVIFQALKDTQHATCQRSVLTLLTTIAKQLEPCSPIVFLVLIPPLLALAGLPAVGPYKPSADLTISADFDVADMALSVLSFLGKRGPSGLYLETARHFFKEDPEQLRLLARCSLECGMLITPVIAPLEWEENYQKYNNAIGQWMQLRHDWEQWRWHSAGNISKARHSPSDHDCLHCSTEQTLLECTEKAGYLGAIIDKCVSIEQTLLECAEEVSYPSTMHLLEMLRRSRQEAGQPWFEIWKTYLLEQLDTANYINYQEVALLWNKLFLGRRLQPLANSILQHYTSDGKITTKYAYRFISYVLGNFRYFQYFGLMYDYNYCPPHNILRDIQRLRTIEYFVDYRNFIYFKRFRDLGYTGDLDNLSNSMYAWHLECLGHLTITKALAETAQNRLRVAERAEKIDHLTIFEGRLLQIRGSIELGKEREEEVQHFAHIALQELKDTENDEYVCRAALYVLQALPAYTLTDIALIGDILDTAQDQRIREACTYALHYARPIDKAAYQKLKKVKKRL
jgi:hypothetical protein